MNAYHEAGSPAPDAQALGRRGEEVAALYLSRLDYRLLDRNWRAGHLEIDLVADHFGEIVFVEVKTRSSEGLFPALDAVDERKKRNLIHAARAYLLRHGIDAPVRFDIITVVGPQPPFDVTHYINAYDPAKVLRRHRQIHYSI